MRSEQSRAKRSYQVVSEPGFDPRTCGLLADIDADAEITLVDETADDQEMFDTGVLDDEEVVVEKAVTVKEVDATQDQVSAAITIVAKDLTVDDITLAKALEALKTSKPNISQGPRFMKEPSEATTTTIPIPSKVQDKGKGIMVEPEMPLKKKAQISLDEAFAFKLQAKEDEQERIIKKKAQQIKEANLASDDVQAKIEAEFELAQRIQAEKQEQLTDDEKARLFMDSKRARDELEQESAKKHKVDDDQEAAELKRCLEIVHDDEDDVTIDATPLSSKSPTIIDYKIYKEGRKSYFQIIRADGSSQMYYTFSKMLKNFNREDLEVLWSIVKARFKKNTTYYLLVEKMYPLTNYTLTQIWNDVRLQVDYEVEMAYNLHRLVRRQLREGYVPE
nr:hypothetical protein [Tanacetum cinerariifolium]